MPAPRESYGSRTPSFLLMSVNERVPLVTNTRDAAGDAGTLRGSERPPLDELAAGVGNRDRFLIGQRVDRPSVRIQIGIRREVPGDVFHQPALGRGNSRRERDGAQVRPAASER